MRKRNVLGIGVTSTDYDEVTDHVIAAARARQPLAVSALAVHGVMTGVLDPSHRRRLNALDVVLPDGQPVRWALNLLFGDGLSDRVAGPVMMLKVCQACAREGLPVALYGSTTEVLAELDANLRVLCPGLRIAAAIPSQFRRVTEAEQACLAEQITRSEAALVFVGLGCPRQEVWLFENRHKLQMPMLAVGAAFDFHARRLTRPPRWVQDAGLEWSFRLLQEPRRLWRRYLLLNPLYLMLLAAQKLHLHRPGLEAEAPVPPFEGYA
jgi:exopolysaccharide biosynthesis WecB/TagA/CpsF family protein